MPSVSFFPSSDAALLAFSLNFSTKITAQPTAYGLSSMLATANAALHAAYATALAACDPAIRTKSAVSTKNEARTALKTNVKLLANLVNGTASVTDAQKLALGLNVRAQPQPRPVPAISPTLEVLSVSGWTAKIRLRAGSGNRRGMPAGVNGASLFSFVGAAAPTKIGDWEFEGSTGRATFDVVFPSSVPAGAKVWLTAFYFNGRKESGPACSPVGVNLPGGSVQMAA